MAEEPLHTSVTMGLPTPQQSHIRGGDRGGGGQLNCAAAKVELRIDSVHERNLDQDSNFLSADFSGDLFP